MTCARQTAIFGNGALALCDARIEHVAGGIRVVTTWKGISLIQEDWTVFLHLYGPGDRLMAQADGYLIGQALPLRMIRPGSSVQDIRWLPMQDAWPDGAYRTAIGVYHRNTGERVKVHSHLEHAAEAVYLGWVFK